MSDEEKIKWFDETMEWVKTLTESQTSEEARGVVDDSIDTAMDLFFDVVDQYEKVTGK